MCALDLFPSPPLFLSLSASLLFFELSICHTRTTTRSSISRTWKLSWPAHTSPLRTLESFFSFLWCCSEMNNGTACLPFEESGSVTIPVPMNYIIVIVLLMLSALFSGLTLGLLSLDKMGMQIFFCFLQLFVTFCCYVKVFKLLLEETILFKRSMPELFYHSDKMETFYSAHYYLVMSR